MSDPAVIVEEVVQVYASESGPVHALRGVSFDLPRGTATAIVGPSGAGKSTLLRLLGGLELPTAGDIVIAGRRTTDLAPRARRQIIGRQIGHVFQIPRQNLLDYLTAHDHIRLALQLRRAPTGTAIDAIAETMGLAAALDRTPDDLTVGEQQRLAFAVAFAGRPTLVVADEPTASLDPHEVVTLNQALADLRTAGQTLVFATHDPRLLVGADRVLLIRNGILAASGPPGRLAATIDSAGRLALDDTELSHFPDRRARVRPTGDGLHIEPA